MSDARSVGRSSRDPAATRQLWADRLHRFGTAGTTVTAFCQAEGVSVPSFYHWKKQLAPTRVVASQAPTILPVRLTSAAQPAAAVEVVLATGTLVRLPGDIRQVQVEPRVGGSFVFSDFRDGVEARHWGTYLELARPHRLVFTWIVDASEEADPSKVLLTIEPDGDGCIATIVHEMDAAWAAYASMTEKGWSLMLDAIASTLRR